LDASVDYVMQRLQSCREEGPALGEDNPGTKLEHEAAELRRRLTADAVLDQDVIEAGVDLFGRVEQHLSKTCPPLTPRDQALMLIARSHAAESK
jgi:hypothetical protein